MDRPNVLFIHTDQQRWDALGANGNDEIHTPNLDALASDGVTFDRYFTQATVCAPSRASYLTGRYPSQLGIYSNGRTLPESVPTIADYLGRAGYVTGNLGKLHFKPHALRDHREPHPSYGFDHVEIADEPGCYPDAYRAWVKQRAPDQLDDVSWGLPWAAQRWQELMYQDDGIDHPDPRFPKRPVPFPADDDLSFSAFVADRTRAFIERHAAGPPFCCIAGFYAPHSPWVVPQRFLDQYDPDALSIPSYPASLDAERSRLAERAEDETDATFDDEELRGATHGYYAMITEVDHYVGRLLETLEQLGVREETMVIFTSDHGEDLGRHLRYGKGWPGYDSITRVPCVIRWPAVVDSPGRSVDSIVEAVDLLPTMLEGVGVQAPAAVRGRSLVPLLRGDTATHRDSALIEGAGRKAVRTDRYRYAVGGNDEHLYDLAHDPAEHHNLADDPDYAEERAALCRTLLERLMDAERRLPKEAPY